MPQRTDQQPARDSSKVCGRATAYTDLHKRGPQKGGYSRRP
jgi:hypothetical protein